MHLPAFQLTIQQAGTKLKAHLPVLQFTIQQAGTKLKGYVGEPTLTSKILPFRRAKMVIKCTSAGHFTGQRTIGELLLLKKKRSQTKKGSQGSLLDPPKFGEATSLVARAMYSGTRMYINSGSNAAKNSVYKN